MSAGFLRQFYRNLNGEILAIPGRVIAVVFGVFLFLLPIATTDPYVLSVLCMIAILSIYAASWDLLAGFGGQLNLGHALFFGVSAYSAALLNIHLNLPPWATIPLGAIIAMLIGLVVGMPALRLRGFYLALVTMAFPILLTGIILTFSDFTGGELGLYGVAPLSTSQVFNYYLILVITCVLLLVMWKLTDAKSKMIRTAIIFHAINQDEITARASGINTTLYKLLAFSLSGLFAGIAGAIYVHYIGVVGLSTLELFFSFQPILWTIFGGIGTIYGAVVGVVILYPLVECMRQYSFLDTYRYIFMAVVLIAVILYMPQGIATWVREQIEEVCPRCKTVNMRIRKICRACGASLH